MPANTDSAFAIHPRTLASYTYRDKEGALLALARCNGNCRKAARLIGIPWTTLRGWAHKMPEEYERHWLFIRKQARQERNEREQQQSADTLTPDPLPNASVRQDLLLSDLNSRANLLIGALTPERIAAAPLPHITRALTALLPRIAALEKAAEARALREQDNSDFHDFQTQIIFILRRHVEDNDTVRAIAQDLDRLTNMPKLLDEEDAEDEQDEAIDNTADLAGTATPSGYPPGAPRSPDEMGEMGERDERGKSIPEAPSLIPMREGGLTNACVRQGGGSASGGRLPFEDGSFMGPANQEPELTLSTSPTSPKTSELSEISERDEHLDNSLCQQPDPTSPHNPLPPSLERGTSGREGGSDECLHSAPGGLGKNPITYPPTLEQLRAIKPNVRWAGGA